MGLDHIVRTHWYSSGAEGSHFSSDINSVRILKALIEEAITSGAPSKMEGNSRIVEADLGRIIGTDPSGNTTSLIRIVYQPIQRSRECLSHSIIRR